MSTQPPPLVRQRMSEALLIAGAVIGLVGNALFITSQLPVSHWHAALGEPTLADAILDRLVHNAYRIELRGDSLRRQVVPGEHCNECDAL